MNYRNHLSPPQFPATWASSWGEDRFGLWMTLNYKDAELTFRWIAPGSFMMGSPEGEKGRFGQEDRHEVTLKQGFWIADTPVTQSFWKAVTGESPSHFKGDDLPVEEVSWDDTQSFIETINNLHPDLSVALPYEAEWEYACRAGTETAFNFGDEISSTKLNYRGVWDSFSEWGEDAPKKTTAIKSYSPNEWGLYDMHGNVLEWCQDEWQEYLGTSATVIDATQAQDAGETARSESGEAGAAPWCAAGPGTAAAGSAVRPSASGTRRTTVSTTWAFGLFSGHASPAEPQVQVTRQQTDSHAGQVRRGAAPGRCGRQAARQKIKTQNRSQISANISIICERKKEAAMRLLPLIFLLHHLCTGVPAC